MTWLQYTQLAKAVISSKEVILLVLVILMRLRVKLCM